MSQLQFRGPFLDEAQSTDPCTASRSMSKLLVLAGVLCMVGCQAIGLRHRDDDPYGSNEEDDWSVPYEPTSQSRVPRPNLKERQTRVSFSKASSGQENKSSASRYDKGPQPSVVGYGPKEQSEIQSDKLANVLDTDEQEIDFDATLSTLPPEYRNKLKMQYAAVRERYKASKLAGNIESRSIRDTHTESESTKHSAPETAETNSSSLAQANASASNHKEPAVKIRMSDSVSEKANPESALAQTPPNGSPTPSHPATSESKVVQASATTNPSEDASSANAIHVTVPGNVDSNSKNLVPANWRQGIGQSIELLEKQIAETPSSDENLRLSQEVTLRMLYVTQRRLEDAVRPIESLSENEQEFIRHQMLALFETSNPDAMPVRSRHWSLVMNSQREATNHLAAASNLEVKSVAFCTEVERYGMITKFPKSIFSADQEVLLYCEIENVSAEKLRNGFETQLQGSYEIIDSQGRKVADQLLPMEPDLCQNHRRDYFIVYKIYMPQQIASGNYQLRLTVEDMKAKKFGQGQIDFQIKK